MSSSLKINSKSSETLFDFTSLLLKFIENNDPNKEVFSSPLFETDKKSELLFTSFVIFISNSTFLIYVQIQCHY